MKTQAVLLIVGGVAVAGGLILWNGRSGNAPSLPDKEPPFTAGQAIAWVRSYPDGMAQAKAAGKPMLVHFHGPG